MTSTSGKAGWLGALLLGATMAGACSNGGGTDGGTSTTGITTTTGVTTSAGATTTGGSTGMPTSNGSTSSGTTGGGSTTSSGTATATSTGGTTGNGCTPDAGFGELALCTFPIDCQCPFGCVTDIGYVVPGSDGGRKLCEQTGCTDTSDCFDPRTICVGGNCAINFCGADLGGTPRPGSFGQACTADDAGSGTCFPDTSVWGICIQGGTAALGAPCLVLDPLSEFTISVPPDQLCSVGGDCEPVGDGGVCYAVGDGGCIVDLGQTVGVPNDEFHTCASNLACQCSSLCHADTRISANGSYCETPCVSDADCPLALETCTTAAGYCSIAFCAIDTSGHVVAGAINGDCAPMDAGGQCLPFESSTLGSFGACLPFGGAAIGDPCDPFYLRSDPSLMCAHGAVCKHGAPDGGTVCEGLCNPGSDGGCRPGEICEAYVNGHYPDAGLCCLSSAAPCSATAACCSGVCTDAGVCE